MKIKLLLLSVFVSATCFAKIYVGTEAAKLVPGADKIIVDDKRQTFSFVHFGIQPVSGDHNAFLKQILGASAETSFQLYATETDKLGWTNYRYYQLYKNVRIENAVYYVHTKAGKILSANGEYYSGISATVSSSISSSAAVVTAKNDLKSTRLADEKNIEAPSLTLFRDEQNKFRLCWKVDAWSLSPMNRFYYFVDANSGKIIGKNNRMCDIDSQGTAATGFNGTQTVTTDSLSPTNFRLFESGRNIHTHAPGPVEITDTDNNWTSTANLDNYATDAHWAAEKTHDLYLTLGRNGIDGSGMLTDIQAHDGMYVNAYWSGNSLLFGDGDGTQYYPLTSAEIVAHEFTHGVTQHSAGLVYSGESGALNESFSDVFGNTVRFMYSPSVASWLIGDQIVIPSMGGTPFRDMSNPNLFQCADTYNGLFFNNGDIVHYDSGIQNYWYYLLCVGGSGTNDIGNSFSVTGIGMADAIQITYRNLSVYLTPNSTFADAANFATQAADDLFGSCSNQVIQTANAWYAVGVGTPFSGVVTAAFAASPAIACSAPANVTFINNSWNGTSFFWDFGDGNNSTATSPTHTYLLPGTYNVTLISTGTGNCIGADTLLINGAVVVNNVPGPVPTSCNPATTSYCCGYGISKVVFHTINWTSLDAIDSYSDFTCGDSTLMVAGSSYPIDVIVNPNAATGYPERVSVWIDYNNDGAFNNTNELVYSDAGLTTSTHSGIVYTPTTATLNTRLRMRVISDAMSNVITGACYAPQNGQVEDYMVYFVPNTLPPIANFTANFTTIPVGNMVNFNDLTLNAPTSWHWIFSGGFPGNVYTQNPTNILYNTAGVYQVKLVATNAFGADSATQTTYINVVNAANICQNTMMTSNSGLLYDSGGPTGNYVDNENCSFLIDPCGTNLQLTFSSFDIENNYDYLTIYDGTSAAAPIIGSYTGNTLPPVANSTSGSLFISFTSDWSIVYTGFEATWSSTPIGTAPAASFSYTPAAPAALIPVQFTDQTLNSPTAWSWDFGDLNSSVLQNPTHTYANAGTYTVTLIAMNCISSDTTTFVITILPNSIEENLLSGNFSVYPNPFTTTSTIHFSDEVQLSEIRIEFSDLSGRILKSIIPVNHNTTFDRAGLSSGMYFITIFENGKLSGSKKIVLND